LKVDVHPPVVALQDFIEQTKISWNAQGDQPAPNSQAALELASFPRRDSVGTAFVQAGAVFEAGADYSMALIKTLTEPGQSFAPWLCARSVVESCALATWLWDTNIHARQRVQRSLAFRHESLIRQLKLARASKGYLNPEKIKKRLEDVEKLTLELGLAKVEAKKGSTRIVLELVMPSVTQIIIDMLSKEEDYRLLSAIVHGHTWAIQAFALTGIEGEQEIFPGVKGKYFEKHLDYSHINFLCIEAITSLSHAILAKFKLYGLDMRPLIVAYNKAISQIKD
jgi:hypothetical protein